MKSVNQYSKQFPVIQHGQKMAKTKKKKQKIPHLGLSENSVPLNPMVLLIIMIIIPFLNGYFIGNVPNIFR